MPPCRRSHSTALYPVLLLLCLSSGILLADRLTAPAGLLHLLALALPLILFGRNRHIALALLSLVAGYLLTSLALQPAPAALQALDGKQVRLQGQVLHLERLPAGWRLVLAASHLDGLSTVPTSPTSQPSRPVRLQLRVLAGPCSLLPGDRIATLARLRLPRRFGTPGAFDGPRHLAQQSIELTGTIPDSGTIVRLAQPDQATWPFSVARWRARQIDQLLTRLPPDQGALVLSLALGEACLLSQAQRDRLARTGLSHLFAISGLHLGLVAGAVMLLVQRLYRHSTRLLLWQPAQRLAPLLSLPIVLLYLALSGASLPGWRAALMLCLGLALLWWQRTCAPILLLNLAAVLLLLANPLALFSASFQLSFAAVAALLLVLPAWHRRLAGQVLRWPALLLLTNLTASLATLPLTLAHFHWAGAAGLLTNLLALPLISFVVLPLCLLALPLLFVWPRAAQTLLQGSGTLLETLLGLCDGLAQGPLAGGFFYLSPVQLAATMALCLTLLLLLAGRWRQTPVLLALLLLLTGAALQRPAAPAGLQLVQLSVGQGEAQLLRTPQGRNYLIDGGGLPHSDFDVGRRLLAPALARLGVRQLDAVLLTHDHPDHRDGLRHILAAFPVRAFYSPLACADLDDQLRAAIQQRGIACHQTLPGWQPFAEGIWLFTPAQQGRNLNDRSLALYARRGNDGLLLTGDLEAAGMRQLLGGHLPGPLTLLNLPHHGSRRSWPADLTWPAGCRQATVSVGHHNRFGFPHAQVLQRLDRAGVHLWRTDRDGTIVATSTGQGWHIRCDWPPLRHPFPVQAFFRPGLPLAQQLLY